MSASPHPIRSGHRIPGPEFTGKAMRARNRRMAKLPRRDLAAAVGAYDEILRVSTEIRARHGLPPVPDGMCITGARARLASLGQPKAKPRKAKAAAPAVDVDALRAQLEDAQRQNAELVAALEKQGESSRVPVAAAPPRFDYMVVHA